MLRIVEDTVRAITPHILGTFAVPELPEPDPQASVDLLQEWLDKGLPEFGTVTTFALLALNLYSLANHALTFPKLNYRAQAALMERLFKRKGMTAYGFSYIVSLPVVGAYYSRIDVQNMLGFDTEALKEESEKRVATRTGSLPEKEPAGELTESGEKP